MARCGGNSEIGGGAIFYPLRRRGKERAAGAGHAARARDGRPHHTPSHRGGGEGRLAVLVPHLRLDGGDVGGRHFADGRHLAVLDLPQTEGAGDVAVLVELHPPDDALVTATLL